MNKEYTSPELEIITLKLTEVILNSYDEHVNTSGNIEDPDSDDMLEL